VIPDVLLRRLGEEGCITLSLKVVPKASKDEVVGLLDDGSLKVKVTAPPEQGKANAAVCQLLAGGFGVAKRNVEILRGETSANKQVRIHR
jgi:uncharacterized protein (TIGR00251 family)